MDAIKQYRRQKNSAKWRGIDWEMSFEEWLTFWADDLPKRGRHIGCLVMARFMDAGPYKLSNVYKATCSENTILARSLEKARGKKPSPCIGRGRGWTYVKGRYQVCVGRKYVGLYRTEQEAVSARDKYVQEMLRSEGATGNGRE